VGKFFSGDSYVVHYAYNSPTGVAHIIYFWLGKASSVIEHGSAAARTKELSDSLVCYLSSLGVALSQSLCRLRVRVSLCICVCCLARCMYFSCAALALLHPAWGASSRCARNGLTCCVCAHVVTRAPT
jgi:hypothetical protein